MALQVVHAGSLSFLDELSIQLFGTGCECNVHQRTVFLSNGSVEDLGCLEEVVQNVSLLDVLLQHDFQTADFVLQVLEDLTAAVDGPCVGCVVHGAAVDMCLVGAVCGNLGIQVLTDQVFTDDDNSHTGGTDVLLNTSPDQAVVSNVAGTGQEHGRLVGDQDLTLCVGQLVECCAVDCLVLADVDVISVLGDVQIGAVGDVVEVLILGRSDDLNFAVLLSLGDSLLGPGAGLNVAADAVLQQVLSNHSELQCAAALDEDNLVVLGNAHQSAQISLCIVDDLLVDLGTMAHLHDAHTAATVVHHLVADLFQDLLRHHSGASGKVKGSVVVHCSVPPVFCSMVSCFRNRTIAQNYMKVLATILEAISVKGCLVTLQLYTIIKGDLRQPCFLIFLQILHLFFSIQHHFIKIFMVL